MSLYLDPDIYEELKRLCRSRGVSVSREIDELIRKRVAELEGREYDVFEEADYEAVKREYPRLVPTHSYSVRFLLRFYPFLLSYCAYSEVEIC